VHMSWRKTSEQNEGLGQVIRKRRVGESDRSTHDHVALDHVSLRGSDRLGSSTVQVEPFRRDDSSLPEEVGDPESVEAGFGWERNRRANRALVSSCSSSSSSRTTFSS